MLLFVCVTNEIQMTHDGRNLSHAGKSWLRSTFFSCVSNRPGKVRHMIFSSSKSITEASLFLLSLEFDFHLTGRTGGTI
jgi:hypothetical protein